MRRGATLTEVLMCLLIMAIGIVSVIALFPISILSAIKATNLTNAKILADNFEEMLKIDPTVIQPVEPTGTTWQGNWQPSTSYAVDDLVMPTSKPGSILPSPFFFYRCTTSGDSGFVEPQWLSSGTINDAGAAWVPVVPESFVVDPMGAIRAANATEAANFGNRYSGGAATHQLPRQQLAALSVGDNDHPFIHPDSWQVIREEIPLNMTAGRLEFKTGTNLSTLSDNAVAWIPQTKGRGSITRPIRPTALNNEVVIDGPGILLPDVDRTRAVTIVEFQPRYTTVLAVHCKSHSGPPEMQCAVIFNRGFNGPGEHVYDANFANGSYNAVAHVAGALSEDQVRVAWETGVEPEPLLKEGNWILDGRNARFLKIGSVGSKAVSGSHTTVVLTLEDAISERTDPDDGNAAGDVGQAILIPGIILVTSVKL